MDWSQFFVVHKDLPREGPGTPEDVAWALQLAALPEGASICDLACGPGGDTAALLAAPGAQVLGIDKMQAFVTEAQGLHGASPRARFEQGDMAELASHEAAPFDMIWCAGALYFLGLDKGPRVAHDALKPGGVLAFSEPAFFSDTPSKRALEMWEGYPTQSVPVIRAQIEAAGFEVLDHRPVSDAGWEAYYTPMEARIEMLRPGASEALKGMLDMCAEEAATWRAVKGETGYELFVARKI